MCIFSCSRNILNLIFFCFPQVDIGDESFIHIRVYKNLPCYGSKIELSGMKTGVSANDNVGYFEGFHM